MKNKTKMKKTTIELTEEQYFFLKEKSLFLQKKRKHYSIVSIIRDLIEADRLKWNKERQ
ncbi:MAG TPA: hypothetical protein PLG94_14400 [Smithellaceae bacterium]|jgi:hypothetical protein|nr:hypothetical protein [Smithellaceae bacterium]